MIDKSIVKWIILRVERLYPIDRCRNTQMYSIRRFMCFITVDIASNRTCDVEEIVNCKPAIASLIQVKVLHRWRRNYDIFRCISCNC